MKIIDAHWELRNLGVTTQEVEVESSDSFDEIKEKVSLLHADYQVIKTPTQKLDIYNLLSNMDFSLAEASIRVSHELKELNCPKLISRFSKDVTFDEMNETEIDLMEKQILDGMFKTDRVILDSYFNAAQAANRYIMWMRDESQRCSKLFNYKYKGEPVGFSCMKQTDASTFYPVLGGVYNIGKPMPIGSVIIYKQLEIAQYLGGKTLYTYISSNNPAVVKVYSQLGYIFEDMKYVFVKHRKAE